ncbi:hypothetical protein [Klebsiella spallanzanii]|uniref:hypothetical protein n=1 Tax=Klebsiella spallanzanii TaxID=2587528 RepID=UPI001174FFFF|nr:hypothetical protein [Klebsiella spallanzanii]VUS79462.1 hypothetical protein SB6419_01165 [Klebsiella spallanzanii]
MSETTMNDFSDGSVSDSVEGTTAPCPYKDYCAFIEIDDSTPAGLKDIDDFHKNTMSFIGSFFEPEEKRTSPVPLQRGIPLSSLNKEIARYASMNNTGDLSDAELSVIALAKEITEMNNFADSVREELGNEEYLNFALLFDESARESPVSGEFSVLYKGAQVKLEDAKFKMRYHNLGANVVPRDAGSYRVEHVKTHGSEMWGDDFVVEVSPNIYIYKESLAPVLAGAIVDSLTDEQKKYHPFETLDIPLIFVEAGNNNEIFKMEKIGESLNRSPKDLASEFVRCVITQSESNRAFDLARDVTIEIIDAAITVLAIVTGAIILRAGVDASIKGVTKVALFLANANHAVEAADKLHNRWIGSRDEGYNPLLEFSRYLDKKNGGGHGVEVMFHTLNTLMVFGRKPQYKIASALVTSGTGAYMGQNIALVNEIKTSSINIENKTREDE